MPPNVLFIVVDDQRFDTVFGNEAVSTPTLDALAESGTSLRPYTTVPICTPARGELVTGCGAFTNGCRWFGESIDSGLVPLPEALGNEGYHTFFTGKWHLEDHPSAAGFDETRRVMLIENENPYPQAGHRMRFTDRGAVVEGHSTDLFTDAAEEFLEHPPREPWFGMVAYFSPHDPRTPPAEYAEMYDPDEIPLPENYMPEHPFDTGEMAIGTRVDGVVRDEALADWPRTQQSVRNHLANYFGMISHHDAGIGRLLTALEESGQAENTVVAFTSDHGLAIGSHGLMGKQNMYEHSVRAPLIVRGPGIPEGRSIDPLCGHYDWYPTLLELLDLDVPPTVAGESYAPLITGRERTLRDEIYCAYRDVQRMIRRGRWKLIYYPRIDRKQLFDIETDPHELHDLQRPWTRRLLHRDPQLIEDAVGGWRRHQDPGWEYHHRYDPRELDRIVWDLQRDLRRWERDSGAAVTVPAPP